MQEVLNMPILNDQNPQALFRNFVWRNRFNRNLVLAGVIISLLLVSVFKYYYPFPAFINGDSYVYLDSASKNLIIDTYPIGYPRFLRLVSVFSSNHFVLFLIQYALIQVSVCFFVFSLCFFVNVNRISLAIILLLLMLNPVTLYIANYVSSDALFLALSLCWFTTLIWVSFFPSGKLIAVHVAIVLLVFIIRYNALYYPFVSVISFFLLKEKLRIKCLGVLGIILLIGLFVLFTSNEYKKATGVRQFSPFSGWQMVNNGMYAYKFIDSAQRKPMPPKFQGIDNEVRRYFDTTRTFFLEYPEVMLDVSSMYMWTPSSPLRIYMDKKYKNDSSVTEFQRWAKVAPLYNEYGMLLMEYYPGTFIRRFLWPNLIKYYAPPVEFLGGYGFRMNPLTPTAQSWFNFRGNILQSRFKDSQVRLLDVYPVIFGVMNAVFVMLCISFFILNGRLIDLALYRVLLMCFWLIAFNFVFSVFASPVALRFQVFPMVIFWAINVVLVDFMVKEAKRDAKLKKAEYEIAS